MLCRAIVDRHIFNDSSCYHSEMCSHVVASTNTTTYTTGTHALGHYVLARTPLDTMHWHARSLTRQMRCVMLSSSCDCHAMRCRRAYSHASLVYWHARHLTLLAPWHERSLTPLILCVTQSSMNLLLCRQDTPRHILILSS